MTRTVAHCHAVNVWKGWCSLREGHAGQHLDSNGRSLTPTPRGLYGPIPVAVDTRIQYRGTRAHRRTEAAARWMDGMYRDRPTVVLVDPALDEVANCRRAVETLIAREDRPRRIVGFGATSTGYVFLVDVDPRGATK